MKHREQKQKAIGTKPFSLNFGLQIFKLANVTEIKRISEMQLHLKPNGCSNHLHSLLAKGKGDYYTTTIQKLLNQENSLALRKKKEKKKKNKMQLTS